MSPDSTLELLDIMEKEQKTLEAILELEMGKNDILVSRDLVKLSEITEKENDFSGFLSEMEDKRVNLLRKSGLTGTLSDLSKNLSGEQADKIKAFQKTLADKLKKLKMMNEVNNKILTESIQFFKYTLDLLAGDNDSSQIYSLNGQEEKSGLRRSLVLDRKI